MGKISPSLELDAIDRKILSELQHNSRLSNNDLAERVGLSASPCWRRVKRLEEDGAIKAHVSLLDAERLGLGVSVFVQVTLEKHTPQLRDRFQAAILERPEVMECYSMTGNQDYLLRVVVPDIAAYDDFLNGILIPIPGVAGVNSSFALKQVKYSTALPI